MPALSKITITPIGTCRINTPLKRGAGRYPISLDYKRTYGFVHTSNEVVQQLLYRKGERTFPAEVLPILFRPGLECDAQPVQDKPADVTIVEISSNKSYLVGDVAVQCNYLVQHFADFFASPGRTRKYWDLARAGDQAALRTFLERDPVYNIYEPADREMLARMRLRLQTYDEVFADMAKIADLVGKDGLLFVTHVNVAAADGSLIAARDKVIRWVKTAATRLGVACFDPTQLMTEFGQERAMERGGLDSTHFTNAFADAWFARVHRDHVMAHLVDAAADSDNIGSSDGSILCENIAAAIDHDDFFDGTRQLFAALQAHPDHVPLQLLHGQVLTRIGDYEGASKLLSRHVAAPEMTQEMRQALMRVLIETGDPEGALSLASQMISDEYENVEIYETAGRAAEELNRPEEAVRYRKLAFRLDPSNYSTGVWVLDHYHASAERELYELWLREVLELLDERGDAALASGLAEWAITRREEQALARALIALAQKDIGLLPAFIEEAARIEAHGALAAVAVSLARTPSLAESASRALRSTAQDWAERARSLVAEGCDQDAYAFAAACLAVQENNAVARKAQRIVLDRLWAAVQEAKEQDAAVIALCESAGEMIYERRNIALLFSRALMREGRPADAQEVARRLHEIMPKDVDAWASHAHLAGQNGDFPTALELYGGLAKQSAESIARYSDRIHAFLASAGGKGLRHIRAAMADQRFDEAFATYRLLERYSDLPQKQLETEAHRMLSSLRAHLRQLDEDDAAPADTLQIAKLMLSLAPDDAHALRRSALDCMKMQDFDEAKRFWQRLEEVSPDLKSAALNVQRCEVLARRQARLRVAKPAVRSLAA